MNILHPHRDHDFGVDFTIELWEHHRVIVATITNRTDSFVMFTRDKVSGRATDIEFLFFDQGGCPAVPIPPPSGWFFNGRGTHGQGINPGMTIRTGCPLYGEHKYDFLPGVYKVVGILTFHHRHYDEENMLRKCLRNCRTFDVVSNMIEINHTDNEIPPPLPEKTFSPYMGTFDIGYGVGVMPVEKPSDKSS